MYEWSGMGEAPNEFDDGRKKKKVVLDDLSPPPNEAWISLDEHSSIDQIAEESDQPTLRRRRVRTQREGGMDSPGILFRDKIHVDTLALHEQLNIRTGKIRRMDPDPNVEYDQSILWGE
jgi:hypothetical protein